MRAGATLIGGAQIVVRRFGPLGAVAYVARGPLLASGYGDRAGKVVDAVEDAARGARSCLLIVQPPHGGDTIEAELARGLYAGRAGGAIGHDAHRSAAEPGPDPRPNVSLQRHEIRRGQRAGVTIKSGRRTDIELSMPCTPPPLAGRVSMPCPSAICCSSGMLCPRAQSSSSWPTTMAAPSPAHGSPRFATPSPAALRDGSTEGTRSPGDGLPLGGDPMGQGERLSLLRPRRVRSPLCRVAGCLDSRCPTSFTRHHTRSSTTWAPSPCCCHWHASARSIH